MADSSESHYDLSRESCVYVSAEIQGTLEKKGNLGKRTKTWCTLQGATLYMQKKQGDVVSNIDLNEAHLVRKISSDTTGTQFEICIKKKSHVFICPTSSECTNWVKALHQAMALKKGNRSSEFYVESPALTSADINVYSEIEESPHSAAVNDKENKPVRDSLESAPQIPVKVSDYAEVYDSKKSTSVPKENDYYDVADLQIKPALPPPNRPQASGKVSSTGQDKGQSAENNVGDVAESSQDDYEQEEYSNAYSVVNKDRKSKSVIDSAEENSVIVRKSMKVEDDNDDEDYADATTVTSKGRAADSVYIDPESVRAQFANLAANDRPSSNVTIRASESSESLRDDDDEDPFQSLMDLLTDRSSPIPEFTHPLTEEDSKPLEELTEFLSNNRQFCRASASVVTTDDNPVSSLKAYLETLNSVS